MAFLYGTVQTTGNVATVIAQFQLPTAMMMYGVEVWIAGYAPATGDHGVFQLRGGIQSDNSNPIVATMIGSYSAASWPDAGAAAWVTALSAATGALVVKATGDVGKTIDWTLLSCEFRGMAKPPAGS